MTHTITRLEKDINKRGKKQWQKWQQHATDPLTMSHHCGWYLSSSPRKITSKPSTKWSISYLLDCLLGIFYVDGLHLWLLSAPIYLYPIKIETVENIWGIFRIYRNLLSKIQYFASICEVWNLVRIGTMTLVVMTK